LMARGGHYAELYNTYFRHQSLEYINSWSNKLVLGPVEIPNDKYVPDIQE